MEISFINVLITVVFLIALTIPAFLLVKTKVLSSKADVPLSALVLYGCQPFLMFAGFQKTAYNSNIAINVLIVAGLTIIIHFVMIGIMYLVYGNKKSTTKINCMRFASVFGNCGYMGIPFLQALFYGTEHQGEILIYASMIIAVFNILTWSIGIYMMTGDKKQISLKKAVINPTVIGIIIGLILFFTVKTPLVDCAKQGSVSDLILTKFMQSVNFMADMITPLAMIVIGIRLANIPIKRLFLDKDAYMTSFLKLIVMSIVSILIVVFLPIDESVKYVVFFLLSMPSATATVLFAVNLGVDGDSASVFVLLSTLLSVITLPLMFLLFTNILSVL